MHGVIFDLDGVIVNTAKFHYKGWKKLADKLGLPFDEEKNEKLKGLSRRDSLLAMLGKDPGEDKAAKWCEEKNAYYLEFVGQIDKSEILPGAMELVREIQKDKGWKQALASSSKNAKLILNKLDLTKYFDAVVDGSETEKAKPDPALFLLAAKKLGLPTDDVVVVEDAESGVAAARAGKMKVIGLGDPKILVGADLVLKDLSQIDLSGIGRLFSKAAASR
ncbi:MAG: beta-phosphoglucomutase [Elusimicrobia bacterium RIFCSPLOWO2_01_FULL_60_11]|nr:MAG: beta-phosphoglucomutase [Elusimicrobia bacterium RIFCSPLOWO2_01_FULL_60_11]